MAHVMRIITSIEKGLPILLLSIVMILLLLLERSILIPMEAQEASVKEMHGRLLHLPDAHFTA
jgi:hypothetical protein